MKFRLYALMALLAGAVAAQAETIDLNGEWRFVQRSPRQCYTLTFDDSEWENVQVPHTWNALDGQDGGSDYRRGKYWYRRWVELPASLAGKTVYFEFPAANMTTQLYVNGEQVGSHTGGYAHFMFDITDLVKPGESNLFAVSVSNAASIQAPPITADFTFYGGMTRGARIVVKDPVHVNPIEKISGEYLTDEISVASSGIRVSQETTADLGRLSLKANLRNAAEGAKDVTVNFALTDAAGQTVAETSKTVAVDSAAVAEATLEVANPHLWNGKADPYRYTLTVTTTADGRQTDAVSHKIGFRYFHIDRDKGFYLNGESYPLRGIAIHDEVKDKGRAVSDQDRKRDLDLMLETGANFLRLAHYQHGDFTYNYLDSLGILCWAEIPVIDQIPTDAGNFRTFKQHSTSQLYELIHQLEAHPSVVVWGVCNEIRNKQVSGTPNTAPLVQHLINVVHAEDPTRPAVLAANYDSPENAYTDAYSMNRYNGWYGSSFTDFGPEMDNRYNNKSLPPVGVSEYGAGANTEHHEINPAKPTTTGPWHPEEYQNAFHESFITQINSRPWLWQTAIWAGIDFACDERNEGDQPGINDKGLVTHDRQIKKDSYYLYKANWNQDEPTLYITSRRYTQREAQRVPVKVYSNCDSVALYVNGELIGKKRVRTNHIVSWTSVTLKPGKNLIEIRADWNGTEVTDSVEWTSGDDPGEDSIYPTLTAGKIQINFGRNTDGSAAVDDYLADTGMPYGDRGNGYTYGWPEDLTSTGGYTGQARDRENATVAAEGPLYNTFVQLSPTVNGQTFNYTWTLDLPNGNYLVGVGVGDPSNTDSHHVIEANGTQILDYTPTTAKPYGAGEAMVTVTDGKLEVRQGQGGNNSKIAYIHVSEPVLDAIYTPEAPEANIYVADSALHVEGLSEAARIRIHNAAGVLVHEGLHTPADAVISLAGLPRGVYLATVALPSGSTLARKLSL